MAYAGTLHTPPADTRILLPAIALVLTVAAIAALATDALVALVIVGGIAVLGFVAVRPVLALPIAFACIMLADVHIGDPNINDGAMLVKNQFGMPFSPMELVMAAGALGLVVRLLFDDQLRWNPGDLWIAVSLLTAIVIVGIAWGMARGADMSALRTETRGLFYLPVLYLIATHFLRTREQIVPLMWVVVITANLMSVEIVYRYFEYVRPGNGISAPQDLIFGHENALLCAVTLILLAARITWSKNVFSEWPALLLMLLPLLALLVMRRRAGMVALDAGLIFLCVVLLKDNFKLFLIAVPLAALAAGALLLVTWNEPGGTGQFARSFQTVTGTETASAARDQASDDYRAIESTNVRLNIMSEPVTGLGFGRPYAMYVPLADLSAFWPMWAYVPHNSIFWMWMKGGILAFVALLALFAAAMCRSMQLMNRLQGDVLKPVAFTLGAIVLMFVLYSYVDLGMVSPRALPLLGMTIGLLGAISHILNREEARERATTTLP